MLTGPLNVNSKELCCGKKGFHSSGLPTAVEIRCVFDDN